MQGFCRFFLHSCVILQISLTFTACHGKSLKIGAFKIAENPVPRLGGTSVPINNSWSDNHRKTACQFPDFFFFSLHRVKMQDTHCCRGGHLHSSTHTHLNFCFFLFFFFQMHNLTKIPSPPQGRAAGRQMSLTIIHPFSPPNSSHWGTLPRVSCHCLTSLGSKRQSSSFTPN